MVELMKRTADNIRVIYTDYQDDGVNQVLTRYVLYNLRNDIEYLLDDPSLEPIWVVSDVYRFCARNNQDTFQNKIEVEYQPKRGKNDPISIRQIKTFLMSFKEVDVINGIKETLSVVEKAYRVDYQSDFVWSSFIEVGSTKEPNYKCFSRSNYSKEYKCYDDIYIGGIADIKELDDLPLIIDEINSYEKLVYRGSLVNNHLPLVKKIV